MRIVIANKDGRFIFEHEDREREAIFVGDAVLLCDERISEFWKGDWKEYLQHIDNGD